MPGRHGEFGADAGEPVTSIALYTDPDAASLFVRQADEAVPLGPALIAGPGGAGAAPTWTSTR